MLWSHGQRGNSANALNPASKDLGASQVAQWLRIYLPSRKYRFNPWVRKITWRRKWQPTPVFLAGESPWTEECGRLYSGGRMGSMGLQRVRHITEHTHMHANGFVWEMWEALGPGRENSQDPVLGRRWDLSQTLRNKERIHSWSRHDQALPAHSNTNGLFPTTEKVQSILQVFHPYCLTVIGAQYRWWCESAAQQIWKTQQWPQDWKRSVFIPIPKKGNAKECSNYRTIALISHSSKVMLKILQARFQQYVNHVTVL